MTSQAYGTTNLTQMVVVCCIAALSSAGLWLYCKRNASKPSLTMIIGFAILFRAIGGATFPVLEDDFYRFLWDGYRTAQDGTPYGSAPSAFFGSNIPELFDPILDAINYPDVPTIYGPTAQWFFYFSHQLSPGALWPLKLFIILADIGIIVLLARTLPILVTLLYAWSPLVIKEFSVSAHPDIWGVFFMLLAVNAYCNKKDYALGALLALAAGVKLFALIVLPFLFLWRWRAWASFVVTGALIAAPFGLLNAWFPAGLNAMSSGWLFNAPLYELMISAVSIHTAKLILITLFMGVGAVYGLCWVARAWRTREHDPRPIPRADLLYALLFLCIPAFNPWYAIWLIPFALYWPRFWVWVGSTTLLLSYACGINLDTQVYASLEDYQHPTWVLATEFGLIIVALVVSKSPRLNRLSKEKFLS